MCFPFSSLSGARSSSRSVCLCLSVLTALLYNSFFPFFFLWRPTGSQLTAPQCLLVNTLLFCLSFFFFLIWIPDPTTTITFSFSTPPPTPNCPPSLSAPYSLAIRDWFSPLSLCFHWSAFISPGQFPHISTQGQGRRADTHCLPWPMEPAR